MPNQTSSEDVVIALTKEEAIVLNEMCARYLNHNEKRPSLEVQDEAEWMAIAGLSALLERVLVEPFDKNYNVILAQAKSKLTFND